MNNSRALGLFLVMSGAIFWGIGGTVSQKLFQSHEVNINWLVTIRLIIAGILLLTIQFFVKDRAQIITVWLSKQHALRLLIFGIIGMLSVQYTYMSSIHDGNAAVATLLQYLAPVLIILYTIVRKQAIITKQDFFTVFLALFGCYLLLTNGNISQLSVPTSAIIWGLLSAVSLAFYTLYAIPLLKTFDSLVIVGWAMIIGGIALSFIHPPWKIDLTSFTLETYIYLTIVILFGTMFAFWFYIESLQALTAKETSLLSSLEPLAAVLTTVFWLRVPFGFFQWAGTLCIFMMMLLITLRKKTTSPKKIIT